MNDQFQKGRAQYDKRSPEGWKMAETYRLKRCCDMVQLEGRGLMAASEAAVRCPQGGFTSQARENLMLIPLLPATVFTRRSFPPS